VPAALNYLYTTIQNTSGREIIFSFIPPHGKTMAPQEQLTVAGNLVDRLAAKSSNRQFKAMEAAVSAGLLTIIATPSVFVYDNTKALGVVLDPQAIGYPGAVLGGVDPTWPEPIDPPKMPT
jgi:hypothetical protein